MSLNERLPLFPITAQASPTPEGAQLTIGGLAVSDLADEYETPLYLFDQATMDDAVDQYRRALAKHYPG